MDMLSKTRKSRFIIDSDPKCERMLISKNLSPNITGVGESLPIATIQIALYVIAHQYPLNQRQRTIFALNRDLYDVEELTIKYEEYDGNGLLIGHDKYCPQFTLSIDTRTIPLPVLFS